MVKKTDSWFKSDKFIFGMIILLGYMVGWIMTGFLLLTPEQAQLFSQGLATLGPVVGLIAASIWKFGKDELEERKNLSHTINTLADKAPPVTVAVEDLTYGPIEDNPVADVADGSIDAPWFDPDTSTSTSADSSTNP